MNILFYFKSLGFEMESRQIQQRLHEIYVLGLELAEKTMSIALIIRMETSGENPGGFFLAAYPPVQFH